MDYTLLQGDVIEVLKTLPANSVQCCVTSPPYWGLRDYGTAKWEGGDVECIHRDLPLSQTKRGSTSLTPAQDNSRRARQAGDNKVCVLCGARRIDNQVGLEPTPQAYVAKMVAVFDEVRRVLRDDGTCWLNLGDSYNGSGGAGGDYGKGGLKEGQPKYNGRNIDTLKPKDLCGIPWRVAFALQDAGWWLRSDIIWAKPNPMPESVKDRPTRSHEYVFLLTKSARYYYDAEAIAEPAATGTWDAMPPIGGIKQTNGNGNATYSGNQPAGNGTRNSRSVWTISTQSYSEAHFATFPTELPERCIKASTSAHGCCEKCGSPWERVTEQGEPYKIRGAGASVIDAVYGSVGASSVLKTGMITPTHTTGWQPTCTCNAEVVPCTVLDPFSGSGTTVAVAMNLGRVGIGIELNPEYIELAHRRIRGTQPALIAV